MKYAVVYVTTGPAGPNGSEVEGAIIEPNIQGDTTDRQRPIDMQYAVVMSKGQQKLFTIIRFLVEQKVEPNIQTMKIQIYYMLWQCKK